MKIKKPIARTYRDTPRPRYLSDGDTFTYKGLVFRVRLPFDEDHEPPWEDGDGHGIVSEWTTRSKAPGERILHEDRRSRRYFDVVGTQAIALRDGWGCAHLTHAQFTAGQLPPEHPTRAAMAACAVDREYRRLRAWCRNEWHYVGVCVTREDTGEEESVWGIEDCEEAYIVDMAYELAEQLIDDDADRATFEATTVRAPWPDVR